MGIGHADLGPPLAEEPDDLQRGRFPDVLDVLLVGDPEDEQAPAAASEAPLESRGVAADDEASSLPGRPCGGDTAEGCGEEVPDGDVTYDDAGVAFHTACNPQLG